MAVRVEKNLDFDMPRAQQVLCQQYSCFTEARRRFPLTGGERGRKIRRSINHAHTLAATTGTGFDEHWIADSIRSSLQCSRRLLLTVIPRHEGNSSSLHEGLRSGLGTHGSNSGSRRPNELDSRVHAGLCKCSVLGQKSISWMDRLGPRAPRRIEDGFAGEVALTSWGRPDTHGFIGDPHMPGVCVSVRVHRDGRDTEPTRRAYDTTGDFTAIGDQNFSEHG